MTTETQFSLPRLNEPAPDFEAKTTHGPKKLADYKGKWLVLFSHPSDFTPVCTTEFIAFAKDHNDFQSLNCELRVARAVDRQRVLTSRVGGKHQREVRRRDSVSDQSTTSR